MKIKDFVLIGILSAILIVVQLTLASLPNVELVSLFIILFTLIYGRKTIFIIYVFVLVEGMVYGFGLWFLNYSYIWMVLYLITLLFKKERSPILWAYISGMFGLFYGALCAIPYFFIGGYSMAFSYWISGILFDITHGISNFVVALVLLQRIYHLLSYLKTQVYDRY